MTHLSPSQNLSPRQAGYANGRRTESWEALYEAAVCEFDCNKLNGRILTAVTAIDKRLQEIADSDNPETLQCLSALETLRALKRLELSSAAD